MTCNNGHTTCIGPICTAANVPSRPKVGLARDREAIMEAIKQVRPLYGRIKETPTYVAYAFTYINGATSFLMKAQSIVDGYSTWRAKVKLVSHGSEYHVSLRLEKVKL